MENIEKIMEQLPKKWEKMVKETCAFKRARQIKSAGDLIKLVMLYILGDCERPAIKSQGTYEKK